MSTQIYLIKGTEQDTPGSRVIKEIDLALSKFCYCCANFTTLSSFKTCVSKELETETECE